MRITQQVENILRFSQDARDSDKELIIIYMQKSGMNLSSEQLKIFRRMPSVETLRRIRQKLQMEGKYPASKSVDDARFEKFKQVRHNIAGSDGEDPEKLLEQRGYTVLPFGEG